jgi:hypothetical protein
MTFILLIFFTAFAMEAIGSYISIAGLSDFFGGDKVILLMGAILDIAKLVSVSFLYQAWNQLTRVMKYYMVSSVVVLMLITSSGAFGYLSSAFQQALQPNKELAVQVDAVKRELSGFQAEKQTLTVSKDRIDIQVASLPTESVRGRRQLMATFKPEQDRINARMVEVDKRIASLTAQQTALETDALKRNVHTGPITYVADTFGVTHEQASKYVILLIIFVFDPLAVALVLAGNFLVKHRKEQPQEPVKVEVNAHIDEAHHRQAPSEEVADEEELAGVSEPEPMLKKLALRALRRPAKEPYVRGPKAVNVTYKQASEPEPEPEAVPEDMPYVPVEESHEVDYGDEIVPIEVTVDQATPITKVELIPEPTIMPSMLDEIKVGLDTALFSTRNRASKVADIYR